jgi:hypothetical protein
MKLKVFRNFSPDIIRLFEERAISVFNAPRSVKLFKTLSVNKSIVVGKSSDKAFQWPHILEDNIIDNSTIVFSTGSVKEHIDKSRVWSCGFCFTFGNKEKNMRKLVVDGSEAVLYHGDFYILDGKLPHEFVDYSGSNSIFLISNILDRENLKITNTKNLVIDL